MIEDIYKMNGAKGPDNLPEKLARLAWEFTYFVTFTLFPNRGLNWLRIFALRVFGAQVNRTNQIPNSVKILKPWKLKMELNSCLSASCDVYNFDFVVLKTNSIVSKNVHLCTASHEYEKVGLPLISKPIKIGANAWVAADCFIGPGVEVGEGSVVGARSVVLKDLAPWTVHAGNPIKSIKQRKKPNQTS